MYGVENQTTAATGNYTGNTCQRRNTERIRPFDTPLNKQMEKAALKFVLEKYKLFRASEMVTNDAPIDFDNRRLQQLIDAIKARFGRYISEWGSRGTGRYSQQVYR